MKITTPKVDGPGGSASANGVPTGGIYGWSQELHAKLLIKQETLRKALASGF